MRASSASGWTDERVETAKRLWLDGHSASQIAEQLGGVTRNAVISKINRLGLSAAGMAARQVPAKPQRMTRPRPVSPKEPCEYTAPRAYRVSAQRPTEAARIALGAGSSANARAPSPIALSTVGEHSVCCADLRPSHCRWPVGPDHGPGEMHRQLFCGETRDGRYCPAHNDASRAKTSPERVDREVNKAFDQIAKFDRTRRAA